MICGFFTSRTSPHCLGNFPFLYNSIGNTNSMFNCFNIYESSQYFSYYIIKLLLSEIGRGRHGNWIICYGNVGLCDVFRLCFFVKAVLLSIVLYFCIDNLPPPPPPPILPANPVDTILCMCS